MGLNNNSQAGMAHLRILKIMVLKALILEVALEASDMRDFSTPAPLSLR